MAQSKITYNDKINNIPITDRDKQASAEDFNEIKQVVNDNADDVDELALKVPDILGREGSVQFKKGTTLSGNDDFVYDEINKFIGLGRVPRFSLDIIGDVGSFALELGNVNPRVSFGLGNNPRDIFTIIGEAARTLLNITRGDFVISMNSEAAGSESLLINKDTGAVMIGPGTFTGSEQLKVNGDIVSSGNVLGLNITAISAKLANIEDGAQVNVQSDWNESNTNSDAYIKNKPAIPTPVVNTNISFKFDPTPNAVGIAAGEFRLNNTTQSLATEMYLSFRSRNSFGLEDAKDYFASIKLGSEIITTYHQNATSRSVFVATGNAIVEADHIRIPIKVRVSTTFNFTEAIAFQVNQGNYNSGITSVFDDSNVAADPGAGFFRFNIDKSEMYINYTQNQGSNIKDLLSDGIKLKYQSDGNKYVAAKDISITDNGTWATISQTIDNEGDAFIDGDIVGLLIIGGAGGNGFEKNIINADITSSGTVPIDTYNYAYEVQCRLTANTITLDCTVDKSKAYYETSVLVRNDTTAGDLTINITGIDNFEGGLSSGITVPNGEKLRIRIAVFIFNSYAYIISDGSVITVDAALDENSTNPVENRVIYDALIPRTDYVTTPSIPFNHLAGFLDTEANALDLAGGDITLSLDTSVTNYNTCHFFYAKGDGIHALNLGNGFNSIRTFPSDLSGKVLDAGTYLFCCIYSPDGIVINVPALGGGTAGIAPTIVSATILDTNLSQVRVVYSKACNDSTGAGFSLTGTTSTSFNSVVSGSGTTEVIYSLSSPATALETINLAYNSSLGNVVAADDNTPLESFADFSVVVGDTTAPSLIGQTIGDVAANVVRLTFDEALNESFVPNATDFVVDYDTTPQTISNVSVSGNVVDLTIGASATSTTAVTVSYTQSAGNELQDASGNKVANFTDVVVSNLLDFGLLLLDANSTDVIVDGSNGVDTWNDTSGIANNAITQSANKPLYQASQLNGEDVVTFGSDAYMHIEESNMWSNDDGFTSITVIRPNNTGDFFQTYFGSQSGSDTNKDNRGVKIGVFGILVNEFNGNFTDGGDDDYKTSASLTQAAWQIMVNRWIPTKETATWVDNVKTVATKSAKGSFYNSPEKSPTIFGAGRTTLEPVNSLTGDIAFHQVFQKGLSEGELKNKIDALASKYGLTIDTSALVEVTPTPSSAVIGRQYNDKLRIYFNGILNPDLIPNTSEFSVTGITGSPTITSVKVGSYFVELQLSGEALDSDTVLLSYTGSTLKSPLGNTVATFSNQAVSNYVINDSSAAFVIDTRISSKITEEAGAYIENKVTDITSKNNSYVCTDAVAAAEARYKESHDGIKCVRSRENNSNVQVWDCGNRQIWNNTNGMTIFIVVNKFTTVDGALLGKFVEFNANKEFYLHDTFFRLYEPGGTFTEATFATPNNQIMILAFRWIPGTEQTAWVNGIEGTAAVSTQASLTASAASIVMNAFRVGQSAREHDWYYLAAYDNAFSNADLKAMIEKLGNIYDVTVDTSGIIP